MLRMRNFVKLVQARLVKMLFTSDKIALLVLCGASKLTNCGVHVVKIYMIFLPQNVTAVMTNFEK